MSPESTPFLAPAQAVASALAVGLLVGLERGWSQRGMDEGGRVAGLRTFGLIGMLGGVLAVTTAGASALAVGLGAIAVLFAVSYRRASLAAGSLSITTAVAGLVTFVLGALAASDQAVLAVAGAVLVALLLGLKPTLHHWLRLIAPAELTALLQLGVLSAVVLPLLPDAGIGPYGSINPFRLWVAVILIAALSLLGHVASRLVGQRRGLLWVGLLGGLASSTAATLSLSRMARGQRELAHAAAAGVLAACGVMFVRMALVVSALSTAGTIRLVALLVLVGLVAFSVAAWIWCSARGIPSSTDAARHPLETKVFDLASALAFGGLLAGVSILARAASDAFGIAGLYGVAFVSGLADVDAVVISAVQLPPAGMSAAALATTVLIASGANLLVKGTMAWLVGGRAMGGWVLGGYALLAGLGAALAVAAAWM